MNIASKHIKIYLSIIALFVGISGFFAGKTLWKNMDQNKHTQSIMVTGKGFASGKAEEARLNFSISVESTSEATLRKKVITQSNTIKNTLQKNGIKPHDIAETLSFDTNNLEYDTKYAIQTGTNPFAADLLYDITLRIFNNNNAISDFLATTPGLESGNPAPGYILYDNTKLQKEARIKALQDARAQIEKIAKDNNLKINKILTVNETQNLQFYEKTNSYIQNGYLLSYEDSGDFPISITYQITYELQPKSPFDFLIHYLN